MDEWLRPLRIVDVITHHALIWVCLDDVIKWKYFPRYWPFVRGIHRSPVNSPHKGQWRGTLMLSLISAWTNGWVNNRDAGDLWRHRAYYDVTVMLGPGMFHFAACTLTSHCATCDESKLDRCIACPPGFKLNPKTGFCEPSKYPHIWLYVEYMHIWCIHICIYTIYL